jgi:hypothetical protein
MTARVAEQVPGYTYGTDAVTVSPVTLEQLEALKVSVGFTEEDRQYLAQAGHVLRSQTHAIVLHWRSKIIASIPNLARHSRSLEGEPLPDYLAKSGLRFEQWILDTCFRPYDGDWINYQHEIAIRHTSLKKNVTDGVESTPHVPLRDIIAFIAVINQTIRAYLMANGGSEEEVNKMHLAWCKSMQLQIALWARPYADSRLAPNEW